VLIVLIVLIVPIVLIVLHCILLCRRQSWTQDPAVAFNGTKGSLFDLLEDMNAAPCIAKARSIALAQGTTTTTSGASGAAML
jgi:hypothetical protein